MYWPASHAPHAVFAVVVHAAVRFWPKPHVSQSLHDAFAPSFWYVDPAVQPGHDPLPAWPVGHDAQLCLLPETAQPDPLLHDVSVCELLSCHVLSGHAPQTMLLSASQAAVCF